MRQPVGHYPGLRLWTALFFFFLYAPMVVLVAYSFNVNKLAMIWGGFSTRWYVKLFTTGGIGEAAMNSLLVAVIATSMALPLRVHTASAMAPRWARFRPKPKT